MVSIVEIKNIQDLTNIVVKYQDIKKWAFRGQIKCYGSESEPSFMTSFERKKCIPQFQSQWTYYATEILSFLYDTEWVDKFSEEQRYILIQALLQHYGWRSFFIDMSNSLEVAAWFASHKYSDTNHFHLINDCFDDGLMEIHINANYVTSEEDNGYLFVFDKMGLNSERGFHFTDLTEGIIDPKSRPVAQQACMFGFSSSACKKIGEALNNNLVEVIKISTGILLEFLKDKNLSQYVLFPNRKKDKFYSMLLSLPRKEISNQLSGMKVFNSSLMIPEYDTLFEKRQPPEVAYYSTFWISDNLRSFQRNDKGNSSNRIKKAKFIKVNNDILFHITKDSLKDINGYSLFKFAQQYPSFVLEFDNIFRCFYEKETSYQKAILCNLKGEILGISEIIVDHPGMSVIGIGCVLPRYYKLNTDDNFIEVKKEDSCPCNNILRHEHHLITLIAFTDLISEGKYKLIKDGKNLIAEYCD